MTSTAGNVSAVKVWVNTSSKVYHCPGTRYYGSTAHGTYMTETEAQQRGCGPLTADGVSKWTAAVRQRAILALLTQGTVERAAAECGI
jgi:hypothetical protein